MLLIEVVNGYVRMLCEDARQLTYTPWTEARSEVGGNSHVFPIARRTRVQFRHVAELLIKCE